MITRPTRTITLPHWQRRCHSSNTIHTDYCLRFVIMSFGPRERKFACNIELKDAEDILLQSIQDLHASSDSYLTTLYQLIPSAYCLTLIVDMVMETVTLGTAFNEVKRRCLQNKNVVKPTFCRDEATMTHLLYLKINSSQDPHIYSNILESFHLTRYKQDRFV